MAGAERSRLTVDANAGKPGVAQQILNLASFENRGAMGEDRVRTADGWKPRPMGRHRQCNSSIV